MIRNNKYRYIYTVAGKILMVIITVLWAAWIISNSLKNADASNLQSGELTGKINAILVGLGLTNGIEMLFIRKLAHFIEYAVLGALVCENLICFGCCRRVMCLVFTGVCAVFSVCDELLQLFSSGRSCSVRDMLIDTSGAAVGILAVYLIFFHVRRSKKPEEKQDL